MGAELVDGFKGARVLATIIWARQLQICARFHMVDKFVITVCFSAEMVAIVLSMYPTIKPLIYG